MRTLASTLLRFSPVELAHRERYLAFAADSYRDADRSFANLYIWGESSRREIAFFESDASRFAVICFEAQNGSFCYLPPIGQGDLCPIIEAIAQNARERGEILTFCAATEQERSALCSAFPNRFSTAEDRDIADYLYSAQSLATLSGKKLHAKRNHINAFTAAHTWEILPLTKERFDDCRMILSEWGKAHPSPSAEHERIATERALAAFDPLALEGALLLADGEPAAFTIGSFSTADTLCVHVEKALPLLQGAFPLINREFVRMMLQKHPSLTTVNREDDMGLPGLRQAKLSWRPQALLMKYTLSDLHHSCQIF